MRRHREIAPEPLIQAATVAALVSARINRRWSRAELNASPHAAQAGSVCVLWIVRARCISWVDSWFY
jgi:hypothetical protein